MWSKASPPSRMTLKAPWRPAVATAATTETATSGTRARGGKSGRDAVQPARIVGQDLLDRSRAEIAAPPEAIGEVILAEGVAVGIIAGGDEEVVAQVVDDVRQVVVNCAGDEDPLAQPV